jgi:hypothetical protein
MADDTEFELVENTDKKWNSTYSHQKAPDPSRRLKNVIPHDKLVIKRGRIFSTDTSQQKFHKEIDEQDQREAVVKKSSTLKVKRSAIHEPVVVKQKFLSKNSGML